MKYVTNSIIKTNKTDKGPCLLTISANYLENEEDLDENRTPLDLICVIDKSDMEEAKFKLIRETLELIIENLNSNDRLSIISCNNTATRDIKLVKMTEYNKYDANKLVNKLSTGGGTDILTGLEMALITIKERKYKNPITSIFLLSGGDLQGGFIKFDIDE